MLNITILTTNYKDPIAITSSKLRTVFIQSTLLFYLFSKNRIYTFNYHQRTQANKENFFGFRRISLLKSLRFKMNR